MTQKVEKLLNELNEARLRHADMLVESERDLEQSIKERLGIDLYMIVKELEEQNSAKEALLSKSFIEFSQMLESKIKAGVIESGATIRGNDLMGVFVKGRKSWDSKGLAGYAVAYPEVLEFQETGKPSARISKVKK